MKLSERVRELYFKKFDDQMDGLDEAEKQELYWIGIVLDTPRMEKIYEDLMRIEIT